jgi:TolA-binding protein
MRIARTIRSGAILLSVLAILGTPVFGQDGAAQKPAADDAATRSYRTASGLLSRGLHELAVEEYQKFLAASPTHEKAPLARYGLAVCLVKLQKYEEALGALRAIDGGAEFPYKAEALALSGQCEMALARPAQALAPRERLFQEYPKHELADDAAAMSAEALYQSGQAEAAAKRCEEFASRWPKSALRERVDLVYGLAAAAGADSGAACERLDAWLKAYPQSAERSRAQLALGQSLAAQGKHEAATAALRDAARSSDARVAAQASLALSGALRETGKGGEAAPIVEALLKDEKAGPGLRSAARFERARLAFDGQRYDDALREFDAIGADAKEDASLGGEAAYWAAKCALRKGDAADAAGRLASAIERFASSPLLAEMRYDRAVALLRAEYVDEAAAALEEFQAAHGKHELAADALHLAAAIEHQRKNYDRSGELCRAFLKKYPRHKLASKVAFLAGENDFFAGRYAEALAAFETFERTFPKDEQAQRAALRIGLALHRLERFDDAAKRLGPVADAADADKTLAAALLALGDIEFQRSEWKAAEARLRKYVSLAAKDAGGVDDALLKAGLACQRQERFEDAVKTFDEFLVRFPQSPHVIQAVFERGQALAMLKQTDAARQAFERVIAEGKDSRFVAPARQHLATLAAANKDFKLAAEQYRLAMDAQPAGAGGADALLGQAESLLAMEDYAGAETAFHEYLSKNARGEKSPRAAAQLAIAMARQDRHADALKTIASLQPHLAKLDAGLRRNVRHEQAWCLRKTNQAKEAAEVYRGLLRDDAADYFAAVGLGEVESAAGRCEAAVEVLSVLRRAEASAIDNAALEPGLYRLGACEFELGKFAEAAATLDRFVKQFDRSPLLASACYFLGEARLKSGDAEKAAEALTRAVAATDDGAIRGPALLRLGEALATLQRWAKSEQAFADYLDKYGSTEFWGQARFGQAWARENQGRPDEAIEAYRDVVDKHKGPTAARAQFQLGECLFAKKQFEDAARELLKVDILFAYPEWSAAALFEAGRCFEQMNKLAEARTQYTAVVEKHKQTKWAELANQRMSALAGGGLPGKGK